MAQYHNRFFSKNGVGVLRKYDEKKPLLAKKPTDSAENAGSSENIFTFARMLLQWIGVVALATEIFFSKYLYTYTMEAIQHIMDEVQQMLERDIDFSEYTDAIKIVTILIVAQGLIVDIMSAHAGVEAERVLSDEYTNQNNKKLPMFLRFLSTVLKIINLMIGLFASLSWCLGDALSVFDIFEPENADQHALTDTQKIVLATLVSSMSALATFYAGAYLLAKVPSNKAKVVVGTGLVAGIGLLNYALLEKTMNGDIHSPLLKHFVVAPLADSMPVWGMFALMMLSAKQSIKHTDTLINYFVNKLNGHHARNKKMTWRDMIKATEMMLLILINPLFRGFSAGFTTLRFATYSFDIQNTQWEAWPIWAAGFFANAYFTLFARTLQVVDDFFPERAHELTPEDIAHAKVPLLTTSFDILVALMWGGSAGVLAHQVMPRYDGINKIVGGSVGFICAGFLFYAEQIKSKEKIALALLPRDYEDERLQGAEDVFKEIQQINTTKPLSLLVDFMVVNSRIPRVIGFYESIEILDKMALVLGVLETPLTFTTKVALTGFLSLLIAKADIRALENDVKDTITHYITKAQVASSAKVPGSNSFAAFAFYPVNALDVNKLQEKRNFLKYKS